MKVKTMTSDLKIINYKYLRNNLTDDNIRTIEIDPEHFLNEADRISLNLSRNFNVSKVSKVFKDATKPKNICNFLKINLEEFNSSKAAFTDAFIGLNLHNILRLSLSEASRPELWNSIIIQNKSALDYISYRINLLGESRELKVNDVFIGNNLADLHKSNLLSSKWWVVELTRNGKDYNTALDAFKCTTYFTDRISQYAMFHKRSVSVGLSTYFANFENPQRFENKTKRNVLAVPDDEYGIIQTSIIDYLLVKRVIPDVTIPNIDTTKFELWQQKEKDFKFKGGPDDFNIDDLSIKKVHSIIDEIGVLRGWKKISR